MLRPPHCPQLISPIHSFKLASASSDSLLAIILVAQSFRGPCVVYSYPPQPNAVARTSKPIYTRRHARSTGAATKAAGHHATYSSSSDSDDEDSGPDDDNNNDEHKEAAAEEYLGYPNSVLAGLLCPSRELCDQPFELVVDHLAFVGHPVWLGDEEPPRRLEVAREEDEDDQDEEDLRGRPRTRPVDLLAVDEDFVNFSHPTERSISEPVASTSAIEPKAVSPIKVVRSPSETPTLLAQSSVASSLQSGNSFRGVASLTSFNFVCVIDTPPDSHLSSHLEGFYKDVVVPMTANIKALERKDKWLGREAGVLRRLAEEHAESRTYRNELFNSRSSDNICDF